MLDQRLTLTKKEKLFKKFHLHDHLLSHRAQKKMKPHRFFFSIHEKSGLEAVQQTSDAHTTSLWPLASDDSPSVTSCGVGFLENSLFEDSLDCGKNFAIKNYSKTTK